MTREERDKAYPCTVCGAGASIVDGGKAYYLHLYCVGSTACKGKRSTVYLCDRCNDASENEVFCMAKWETE